MVFVRKNILLSNYSLNCLFLITGFLRIKYLLKNKIVKRRIEILNIKIKEKKFEFKLAKLSSL